MENKDSLAEIQRLLPEIAETRAKLKTVRDQLRDAMEQSEEFKKLADSIKELATKRAEARKLLMDDKDYQQLKDEVEDYRLKLKDLEEILSHYLLSHYEQTKTTQITDSNGETRQVVITAKIGKATE
ncbi:hypothetical protein HYX70_01335 [Candidatus Saccharibacteria bacterium]|nr:hypothetical protein [Candidatus Saccharibacteria bacterium]